MASAMIGNLAVSLTMNTAAFQRGATLAEKRTEQMRGRFAAATTSVKGLGAALGVTLGADILYKITAGAFEMASGLSEAAEQVGVTVEGLQELRFAAEQTGVGTDKIEAAMKRLSKSLGDLQLGKKSTVAAFEAIGLSADELRGKRPDEALRVIADALNQIPDASQRVAIGQQLMGRSFSDLLPLINGGSAALDEYAEANRRNGQISTEDAKKLDDLADNWGRFKDSVSVATANIIADVIPMAEKVGGFLDATRQSVANFRETVISSFRAAAAAVRNFVTSISQWLGNAFGRIVDDAKQNIREIEGAFAWLYDRVVGHSHVPDMVTGIATEMARLDAVMVQPVTNATTKAERAFRDMAGDVKALLDDLFPQIAKLREFNADDALLGGAGLSPDALDEARRRLRRRLAGIPLEDERLNFEGPSDQVEGLDEGLKDLADSMARVAERAGVVSQRVSRTFQQMANDTLSAFSRVTDAIKGGGFLSILESVIGLGLQLGSVGLFGNKIQSRINAPAGTAGYISPPRSGSTAINLNVAPSPLFEVTMDSRIAANAPAIASAGARGGVSLLAQSSRRRLA